MRQNITDCETKQISDLKKVRPIRVLHIGNIANNAYINAKILNKAGIFSDVLCYNYYHIMGCPEWEDADFDSEIKDQFYPDWAKVDLCGFKRPEWFTQGPLGLCVRYLTAKHNHDYAKVRIYSTLLKLCRTLQCSSANPLNHLKHLIISKNLRLNIKKEITAAINCLFRIRAVLPPLGYLLFYLILFLCLPALIFFYFIYTIIALPKRFITRILTYSRQNKSDAFSFEKHTNTLITKFNQVFPNQKHKLTKKDIMSYKHHIILLRKLFAKYDIIHCYATDGIYPLIADKSYIAYEHGTIRNIPFENTTQGRLCAATYKFANHVCITNADNIQSAKKLGLKDYTFIPHPINEEFLVPDKKNDELRTQLIHRLDSDFIVFHPSRQHWENRRHPDWEKGNDIFIKGFAAFVKNVNPKASAVFVDWGKYVDESKSLLERLGVSNRVLWIRPQPNRKMVRYIFATDMLADQFYLGAFGSTMPKALACGKPSMLYLNEEIHKWCFEEMPPVINAKTEQQVFDGLKKLYTDKEWAKKISQDGIKWYEKYHSNKVILEKLVSCYEKVLTATEKTQCSR
jgi:glycosyltransferase involved in cell wall biosynthesis